MNRNMEEAAHAVCRTDGLICFWDFQEPAGRKRVGKGPQPYELLEGGEPVGRENEGVFSPYSARLDGRHWFRIAREQSPALDIHGPEAKLTVAAWVNWRKAGRGCQAIAGIWNETQRKRQYCMFLNLKIWDSQDQVCGHVSSVGGPTPGFKYCMTSAIGATPVSQDSWHFATFTYDGQYARVYLDGKLDEREIYNPFHYPEGVYDGGPDGAEFTVGGVDRSGEMGNFYTGLLGGLAIYNRALSPEEIAWLHARTMGERRELT